MIINNLNNNIRKLKLKDYYMPQNLLYKVLSKTFEYSFLKIKSKNFIITEEMVDNEFFVYNGKIYQSLLIKINMVGYKLGEFIFTRESLRKKLKIKSRKKYRRKRILKKKIKN